MKNKETESFTLCFFEVGQGDSIGGIITSSKKLSFLVDIVNEEIVSSFFKSRNIDTFDFIIISHNDADHYSGLNNLIKNHNFNFKTSIIYLNHDHGPSEKKDKAYATLLRRIQEWTSNGEIKGSSDINIGTKILTDFNINFLILHPSHAFLGNMLVDNKRNDASVVIKITYQGKEILLTGDIQAAGIEELLKNNKNLKCDILKIPHHGSYPDNDVLIKLIEQTNPQYAIISVGTTNRYNHPHKETIAYLKSKGIKILCTQVTPECCPDILGEKQNLGKIENLERGESLSNDNSCSCAGNISIKIADNELSIMPSENVLSEIRDMLKTSMCK